MSPKYDPFGSDTFTMINSDTKVLNVSIKDKVLI